MSSIPELPLPACIIEAIPEQEKIEEVRAVWAEALKLREDATKFDTVKRILCAGHGDLLGCAIYANLSGTADQCDHDMVYGTLSRQHVSRWVVRYREGLGLALRVPKRARDPKKAKPRKPTGTTDTQQ